MRANGMEYWHREEQPCVLAGLPEMSGAESWTYGGLSYVGTDAVLNGFSGRNSLILHSMVFGSEHCSHEVSVVFGQKHL